MKFRNLFAIVLALCVFVGPAFGAVLVCEDGGSCDHVNKIDITSELNTTRSGDTVTISKDQSGDATFKTSLLAEGGKEGASTVSSSSTNLAPSTLPYRIIWKYVGGSADDTGLDFVNGGTRLPDGTDGQVLTLFVVGQANANAKWRITPVTATGFTSVTLNGVGKFVTLNYQDETFHGGTIGWIITSTNGDVTVDAADLPGR